MPVQPKLSKVNRVVNMATEENAHMLDIDTSFAGISPLNEWTYSTDYWNSQPTDYVHYGNADSAPISPRHPKKDKGRHIKRGSHEKFLLIGITAALIYILITS